MQYKMVGTSKEAKADGALAGGGRGRSPGPARLATPKSTPRVARSAQKKKVQDDSDFDPLKSDGDSSGDEKTPAKAKAKAKIRASSATPTCRADRLACGICELSPSDVLWKKTFTKLDGTTGYNSDGPRAFNRSKCLFS